MPKMINYDNEMFVKRSQRKLKSFLCLIEFEFYTFYEKEMLDEYHSIFYLARLTYFEQMFPAAVS